VENLISESKDSINIIDACSAEIDAGTPKQLEHDILYHLTDIEGFTGIVSNKIIWASLATTLNDCLEIKYGIDLAVKLLRERLLKQNTEYEAALLGFLLDPSTSPHGEKINMMPFVVSLCCRIDKSSQWLHYGRSGQGLAIGLSSQIAKEVGYDLIQIDYSVDSQKDRMHQLFEVGTKAIDSMKSDLSQELQFRYSQLISYIVSLYVYHLAIRIKHPSFSEEEEWRLVAHFVSGLKEQEDKERKRKILFRQVSKRLIPYEELNFSSSAEDMIKEVVVGYSAIIGLDAVQLLLLENGLNPLVKRSEVPVR